MSGKRHFARERTARLYCHNSFCRRITVDQEPAVFATLEAEFAKGLGQRTANIVLDGQVNIKTE
jgi:hypothetical protein